MKMKSMITGVSMAIAAEQWLMQSQRRHQAKRKCSKAAQDVLSELSVT